MITKKTFSDFVKICENIQIDEIAAVPAGKKLTYKGGQPLPKSHQQSLQRISRLNKDNDSKRLILEPPTNNPSSESSPKGRRVKHDLSTIDRSNASTQGNTRRGRRGGTRSESVDLDEILLLTPNKRKIKKNQPSDRVNRPDPKSPNYYEQQKKYIKSKQHEETENFDEGIGMTMANAIGNPPPLSKRMRLKQSLINREIEKNSKKSKRRRFSGLAADPNQRRGPRSKNSNNT